LPEESVRYVDMQNKIRILTAPARRSPSQGGFLYTWHTGSSSRLRRRSALLAKARKGEPLSVSPRPFHGHGNPWICLGDISDIHPARLPQKVD